jgi:hypothetical protein
MSHTDDLLNRIASMEKSVKELQSLFDDKLGGLMSPPAPMAPPAPNAVAYDAPAMDAAPIIPPMFESLNNELDDLEAALAGFANRIARIEL